MNLPINLTMKLKQVMTNRKTSFLAAVIGVFAVMLLAVIVRETISLVSANESGATVIPVMGAKLEMRRFADVTRAVGTAKANESVSVRAKVSDTISTVSFDSGELVEKDQVLVELVNTEEAAALTEARATLAEHQRRKARIGELMTNESVSEQMVDEVTADTLRAQAQVNAIEARLADRLIRAPFAGVVGLRNITAGERIDTGTVIATLNDIEIIKLDFEVPERFLSTLQKGQTVEAIASAYPDMAFHGTITDIDNQVSVSSRSVTVRAEIPNEHNKLVPGMLLSIEVKRNERESLAIPESALVRMADQAFVFVLEESENGLYIAKKRDVSVGSRMDGIVEIIDGLAANELIVSEGTHRASDDALVRADNLKNAAGNAVGAAQ